ncbi:MAG: hypothetical protein J1E79_01340 [Rikenella sp.]|nr:hypothetical protein [Rikenella sp.]
MKREIKFRGKRLDTGEWIYSDESFVHTEAGVFIGPYNDEKQVDPDTVGQYTGLKDRNGKEIFEGDIINWLMHRTDRTGYIEEGYVEFRTDEQAVVVINMFATRDGRENVRNLLNCRNDLKVVGNIHDNPEWLKGGER